MKATYLTAASIMVEANGIKILSDPWLSDGAFYGSWYHFPPFEEGSFDFTQVDYIYISHIHEDHLDPHTLSKIDKSIPVLIHKFDTKFLKLNIEKLGFSVIEFEHGVPIELKNGVKVSIYATEKCAANLHSKQAAIDTFMVIDDGEHVAINTNDCLLDLIEEEVKQIKKEYKKINLLMCCYTNASSYPQCTVSLGEKEMLSESERVKSFCYDKANKLIQILDPEYYMPFAGHYVLAGRLVGLNKFKANTSPYEAKEYFEKTFPYSLRRNKCVVLNSGEFLDLKTGEVSQEYEPAQGYEEYLKVLSQVVYSYEQEPMVAKDDLYSLFGAAYERMEKNRKRLEYETETDIFVYLFDDEVLKISMNGGGYSIVDRREICNSPQYVVMRLDLRLLYNILQGPRFAHWDNADSGSHIEWEKKPNLYERGIYHAICFFHR